MRGFNVEKSLRRITQLQKWYRSWIRGSLVWFNNNETGYLLRVFLDKIMNIVGSYTVVSRIIGERLGLGFILVGIRYIHEVVWWNYFQSDGSNCLQLLMGWFICGFWVHHIIWYLPFHYGKYLEHFPMGVGYIIIWAL